MLFPERPSPAVLFEKIRRHRPTILINVPTMIHRMVSDPAARERDLGSLRARHLGRRGAASGAVPPLGARPSGVELLDGLGTAEMWHIFISNRPGAVRPGTLGQVVPGFEVKLCDDQGREVGPGEVGALWVRGGARATQYWRQRDKTRQVFRGEWVVTGDLLRRDCRRLLHLLRAGAMSC
ncbi:MAG: hypothetical protein KatS3mg102_2955 [Planctomycetota bacterium]|nr:MAG: hypothetical protein KatS3mg102_2955 [Planctomycetota bacterium]